MQNCRIVDPRVESLTSPLGVATPRPRLSWRLASDRRGARQVAYRISVASSPDRLSTPDFWDSGKQASAETLDVIYAGSALTSGAQVWWRIESWDEQGQCNVAESSWEMGLLAASDWKAQWLAVEGDVDRADREAGVRWTWGAEARHEGTRKLKLRFSLREAADVTVMVGGGDRMDGLWIDGQSHPVLRPTQIDFVAPPLTEVTLKLERGDHVVAAEVSFNPNLAIPTATGMFCALVRIVDSKGAHRLVTPGEWKTSLTADGSWQSAESDDAGWVPVRALEQQRTVPWPARPAMLLRHEFQADTGLRTARLRASALGAFEASLNGQCVGDEILAPGYTDGRLRTPYRTFDVTALIRPGANAIGFLVGDGWFASACAPGSRYPFVEAPRRLLAQLELVYEDGRQQVVGTDESWLRRESAVRSSEIYNGEDYDARLEVDGWDVPGADPAGWASARQAPTPAAPLASDIGPPVRVTEVLDPVSVTPVGEGTWLYDFGQNCAAVPRLTVKAAAGARVVMRFGELLKDGRLDQANLRAARSADFYICRGSASGETYQPHFTFHGFRYAEIECVGAAEAPGLQSCVVHTDLPVIGSFETAEPLLTGIWRNALWGQRSNFVGIPTDCPQRDERLGWTGDALVFWDAATLNMDVGTFARRYLEEVRFAQLDDGAFPVFAPTCWRQPPIGPTPGWADAGVLLPWTTWRRTGNTAIIEDNWEAMERYLASILKSNPEMRWLRQRGADFGDWLSVDSKFPGDATTPKDLIATAIWAFDCAMMADMAAAIGRADEAASYRATRRSIVAAFQAAYVGGDGKIGNGSQTSYILPLYFGLLDPEQGEKAAGHLAANIRERGGMLTTGFLGTPFALHVLADHGFDELALTLLRRTEYPSWGYMLKKGATTMWERWNSDTEGVQMNSYNHYAFGAVSSFLMRRVAGIDSLEPGFRRIRIRPLGLPGLGHVSGSLNSPVGSIRARWSVEADVFKLALDLPANARAEVHLGGGAKESGVEVGLNPDLRVLDQKPGHTVVEAGSGHFEFVSGIPKRA